MSPPNITELFAKAQEMQGRLEALRRDLAGRRYTGSAGGGMVTAVATGDQRIVEVKIEPSLLRDGDLGMIEDLCAAAVNTALTNAQQAAQEEMQRLSGTLGLPDLGGFGLGG